MKIVFEWDGDKEQRKKITIETNEETIDEILAIIRDGLIAYGFHPNIVKEGILGLVEDYELENKEK